MILFKQILVILLKNWKKTLRFHLKLKKKQQIRS